MTVPPICDENLVHGLPLPLAQLYRRAHNAKTPLEQHHAAFYLWEAALKLLGSVAVVAYAERGSPDPQLVERLANLARPALGHWWEFVRLLVPVLAEAGDEPFQAVRDLLLGRTRDDLPRAAGLDAALREVLDGTAGARNTVRPSELFDRLVRYRNRELGHGASGQRDREFHSRMGRAIVGGVAELLGRLDVLAGRRLLWIPDVRRQASGAWLIERYELLGESPRRIESLEVDQPEVSQHLLPERLYLERKSATPTSAGLACLHPLLIHDSETEETFFLNARRGRQRIEYLCYGTGRVVDRQDLGQEQRELLARVLGMSVAGSHVEAWAARSQAEEPPASEPGGESAPAGTPRTIGEFQLLSQRGVGGMGVVYRAWQPSLGRQVALKCLLRVGDPKAEARFAREIRALGRVEHPNLVKIFTSGADGDQWFYAMELVEGATLATVCERLQSQPTRVTELDLDRWAEALSTVCEEARQAEQPLSAEREPRTELPGEIPSKPIPERPASAPDRPPVRGGQSYVRRVVELVRQVASAAQALHEAGVLHRDIKPGNIMVGPDGTQAVLMDLGLAQLADDAQGKLTRTRQFVGTLRYASPEQVLAAGTLDWRSDVYSLGATLWEVLTLRPLYGATEQTPTPELMQRIQYQEPERLRKYHRDIPADLEAIVLKCLEKDRNRRYATARDLAEDLGRWLGGKPVLAQPPTLTYVLGKYVRRHRLPIVTGAVLLVMALVGAIAAFVNVDEARRRAERAQAAAEKAGQETNVERRKAEDRGEQAEKAARQEQRAREEAETARRKAQGRLVDLYVTNGVRLMEEGDLLGSATWFAGALREEKGGTAREQVHRVRLEAVSRQCPRLLQTLFHEADVQYAEFHPDGRRVVTAGGQKARIWDVATGAPVTTWLTHPNHVVAHAAFRPPDGRQVLTAAWNYNQDASQMRLWDAATGQPLTPAVPLPGLLQRATFSSDGSRIVTGTWRNTLKGDKAGGGEARVWNGETLQPIGPVLRHGASINHATFSSDGQRVATAGSASPVRIWDATMGRETVSPLPHHALYACFAPGGQRLATAGLDQTIRLWDMATGRALGPPMYHAGPVQQVSFDPSGRYLLSASDDQTAQVWDAETGRPMNLPMRHRDGVLRASFSPDGLRVLTASLDQTARVWEPSRNRALLLAGEAWGLTAGVPASAPMKHNGVVRHAAFSRDGARVLTAGSDQVVRIWDLTPAGQASLSPQFGQDAWLLWANDETSSLVAKHPILRPGVPGLLAWAPQMGFPAGLPWGALDQSMQRYYGSESLYRVARVWDAATGAPLSPPLEHAQPIRTASLSKDSRLLAAIVGEAEQSNEVLVWDVRTGRRLTEPLPHAGPVQTALFDPDGRLLVTTAGTVAAPKAGVARVWDLGTGKLRYPPLRHDTAPDLGIALALFSPDGKLLATGGHDFHVRVWDTSTGTAVTPALEASGPVVSLSFSPDGRRVLAATNGNAAHVWDALRGTAVTPALPHAGWVNAAAFSPDGKRLATASRDATARVWDADSGKPLTPPLRHAKPVSSVAFSRDGSLVLTTAFDGTARVWDAATGVPVSPPLKHDNPMVQLGAFSTDGRRAITYTGFRRWTWDLSPNTLTPRDAVFLAEWHAGQRLDETGSFVPLIWSEALDHLTALIRTQPGQWVLHWHRGRAFAEKGRRADAIADYTRAIELGATGGDVWKERGDAHYGSRQWQKTAADYTRAIELGVDDPNVLHYRGIAYSRLGQYERTVKDATKVIARFPRSWGSWLARGFGHAGLGQWDQAEADYAKAIELGGPVSARSQRALARLAAGDRAGFRKQSDEMLKLCGPAVDEDTAFWAMWTCVIVPDSGADPAQLVKLAERPLARLPGSRSYLLAHGAALYRAGRYDDALRQLTAARAAKPAGHPLDDSNYDLPFLAMVHQRLGHAAEAKEWLAQADRTIEQELRPKLEEAVDWPHASWTRRLLYRLQRTEAEALLRPD